MANNRKRDIVRDIESHFGGAGALCQNDVGRYLNLSPTSTRSFCADIRSFAAGGKKMFLAIDIADKIIRLSVEPAEVKPIVPAAWR